MKKQQAKLGILDWGIGGISIVKLLKEKGNFPLLYFSDTGAVPYGRMSRFELVARLNSVIDFLRSKGATHVVIGCNAASTAVEFLDSKDVKIEGIIESAVNLSAKLKPKNLAVIGGRRTILVGNLPQRTCKTRHKDQTKNRSKSLGFDRKRRHFFRQIARRSTQNFNADQKFFAYLACLHALSGNFRYLKRFRFM